MAARQTKARSVMINVAMDERLRKIAALQDRSVTSVIRELLLDGIPAVTVSDVYGPGPHELLVAPFPVDMSLLHDEEITAGIKNLADTFRLSMSEAYRVAIARGLNA